MTGRRVKLPADALPADSERVRTRERAVRALPDDELESRLVAVERALAELRRELQDAVAWRDALDAEKDRRSVQRRAGRP